MDQFNLEQKEYVIGKLLDSPEGRMTIAATMIEPIKKERDYIGIGRKLLLVDNLPPGAPAWYDKDIKIPAIVSSERGDIPRTQIEGTRMNIDVFAIASNARVPILETAIRRFNILDRTKVKAAHDVAEMEDYQIFKALYTAAAATGCNTVVTSSSTGLDRATMNGLFAAVEANDVPVAAILLHPNTYKDLRAWSNPEFDPVTQREVLKTGLLGQIWGADIYRSKMVTAGTALSVADIEYLGVMPIRIDLDVIDYPMPLDLEIGWIFYEFIGFGIAQVTSVGYCASVSGTPPSPSDPA